MIAVLSLLFIPLAAVFSAPLDITTSAQSLTTDAANNSTTVARTPPPTRYSSELICVKICLLGPRSLYTDYENSTEEERVRHEDEAHFASLNSEEQRHERCATAKRLQKCLRICPPKGEGDGSGDGGQLRDYLLTEFIKLGRVICDHSSNSTDGVDSGFWTEPEFVQKLQNCRLLLEYDNEKKLDRPSEQTCLIASSEPKTGEEICGMVKRCRSFLHNFCETDVADFFDPIIKLKTLIAEIFNGSEMPQRECAKWFEVDGRLIRDAEREENEDDEKEEGGELDDR